MKSINTHDRYAFGKNFCKCTQYTPSDLLPGGFYKYGIRGLGYLYTGMSRCFRSVYTNLIPVTLFLLIGPSSATGNILFPSSQSLSLPLHFYLLLYSLSVSLRPHPLSTSRQPELLSSTPVRGSLRSLEFFDLFYSFVEEWSSEVSFVSGLLCE